MSFLMIENPGIADPQAFTILGATTKRDSENSHTIGVFGSGNKHSVATCLRHHLTPTVFCGNLRLEFGTRPMMMDDKSFDRVQVKYGGRDKQGVNRSNTEDLGFVLDYGAHDWLGMDLALREFVSNSIDRAVQEVDTDFGTEYLKRNDIPPDMSESQRQEMSLALKEYCNSPGYAPWDNVAVKVVEENQVRAKSGCTRVFIPMNVEVFKFYENLGKWFLHFSEPALLKQTILPKKDRNVTDRQSAVIYRRGVRVREVLSSPMPSIFDYNLEDLKLDESRQVEDYTVKNMATVALSNADAHILQKLFLTFDECEVIKEVSIEKPKYWEHTFDSYTLYEQWASEPTLKRRREEWSKATRHVYGETMIAGTEFQVEMAGRKGHRAKKIPLNFATACDRYTDRTVYHSLSLDDREGRDVIPAMADATVASTMVWECLKAFDMTKGKEPPKVFCFRQMIESESLVHGFQRGDSIYLNTHLCTDRGDANHLNELLVLAAVEEVSHYITGAADMSRDFQSFAFTLAAKLMKYRVGV